MDELVFAHTSSHDDDSEQLSNNAKVSAAGSQRAFQDGLHFFIRQIDLLRS